MTEPVKATLPTAEDLASDLLADLAVCDAATPGPWVLYDSRTGPEHFGFPDAAGEDVLGKWQICGGYPEQPEEGYRVLGGEWEEGTIEPTPGDLRFVIAARKGWPAALRRLIAREVENAKLKTEVEHLRSGLQAIRQLVPASVSSYEDDANDMNLLASITLNDLDWQATGVTLADYLKLRQCKGFRPGARYTRTGGQVTAFWDNAPSVSETVTAELTIHRAIEGGHVTGCTITSAAWAEHDFELRRSLDGERQRADNLDAEVEALKAVHAPMACLEEAVARFRQVVLDLLRNGTGDSQEWEKACERVLAALLRPIRPAAESEAV